MFAAIFVPEFFLQALLRAEPGLEKQSVVLLGGTEKRPVVMQLTGAARAAGIFEGMTPTQALARSAAVQIRSRVAAQEQAATDALLQCAYSFSPTIESTTDGVCILDLAGLPDQREEDLARKIHERLARLHLPAQVGIANNPWLALLAARAGRPCRVVRDSRKFLETLPVESIGPTAETLVILEQWGIRTVGEFVSLGKEALATRLGPEALALHERAEANSSRPLRLVRPPHVFEETMCFEQGVETIEPLLFILRRFLEQVLLRLENMSWVAQELRLRLLFESGDRYDKTFPIPAPTSNAETLFRMLHTHLETLRAEHPITGVELSAKPGQSINHQFGLFESVLRDPNHFHETLARLAALVGPDRAGTPVIEESYRPDAFRIEPVSLEDEARPRPAVAANETHGGPVEPRGPALFRFRPAIPADVQVAAERPAALNCNVVHGPVRNARGPWKLSGQWWERESWGREEWDIEASNGRFYRLTREPAGWFVEGVYD